MHAVLEVLGEFTNPLFARSHGSRLSCVMGANTVVGSCQFIMKAATVI